MALGGAIFVALGYSLATGPLRDTGLSRFLHGDVTRSDAVTQCIESADRELAGADTPTVSAHHATFDGNDRLEWTVAGNISAGKVEGPFLCKIGWTSGGATSWTEYLSLPNGHVSRVSDGD
ncbi:hypothetical protein GCM10022234_11670 [Aeromicrobium panaciterrae]